MTTLAEEMALWVAGLRYEELPPQVLAKSKQILLDTIGCALGALEAPPARQVAEMILGMDKVRDVSAVVHALTVAGRTD